MGLLCARASGCAPQTSKPSVAIEQRIAKIRGVKRESGMEKSPGSRDSDFFRVSNYTKKAPPQARQR
jgi:hypothetical protein